jgi:hypothetical protein
MNLQGQRLPDKPFFDIASGLSHGNAGGSCWACPSVDVDGAILVTERNAATLIGVSSDNSKITQPFTRQHGNAGCDVVVRYVRTQPFPEPGLMGLDGVKDLIVEKAWFDAPTRLTLLLHNLADSQSLPSDSAAARTFVQQKWRQIASNPSTSQEFRGIVYAALRQAALRPAANRTAAEKKLLASFQEYIRQKRMYLAGIALDTYKVWKVQSDQHAALQGPLANAFYYGTVPLDYNKVIDEALGGASVLVGGAGPFAAAARIGTILEKAMRDAEQGWWTPANVAQWGSRANLVKLAADGNQDATSALKNLEVDVSKVKRPFSGDQLFNFNGEMEEALTEGLSVARIATVIGPAVIQAVFAVLESIAIDQFEQIVNALPKLTAAQTAAAQPVDMATLLGRSTGDDEAFLYWTAATNDSNYTDPQLTAMAVAGNNEIAKTSYARPGTPTYPQNVPSSLMAGH